jgi:hypothetical protein
MPSTLRNTRNTRNARRFAATLLVAAFAALACATPSHASVPHRYRSLDDGVLSEPLHAFFSLLLQLFEKGGGGMDPNGCH